MKNQHSSVIEAKGRHLRELIGIEEQRLAEAEKEVAAIRGRIEQAKQQLQRLLA
jgi:hypothetical protein